MFCFCFQAVIPVCAFGLMWWRVSADWLEWNIFLSDIHPGFIAEATVVVSTTKGSPSQMSSSILKDFWRKKKHCSVPIFLVSIINWQAWFLPSRRRKVTNRGTEEWTPIGAARIPVPWALRPVLRMHRNLSLSPLWTITRVTILVTTTGTGTFILRFPKTWMTSPSSIAQKLLPMRIPRLIWSWSISPRLSTVCSRSPTPSCSTRVVGLPGRSCTPSTRTRLSPTRTKCTPCTSSRCWAVAASPTPCCLLTWDLGKNLCLDFCFCMTCMDLCQGICFCACCANC